MYPKCGGRIAFALLLVVVVAISDVDGLNTQSNNNSRRNVQISPANGVGKPPATFPSWGNIFNKHSQGPLQPLVVEGVGVEGCKLPSPSKINTLPTWVQGKTFVSSFVALALGTQIFSGFLTDITTSYDWVQTWRYTWPLLGAVYVAAGISHFTPFKKEFCNIYPPRGTWGVWYLPGSPEFHVQWTGIAEIAGGLGLLAGVAIDAFAPVYYSSPNFLSQAGLESDSAAALFLLTLAVTPANIYMFTHGAKIDMDGPTLPVSFHAARGVLQVLLLSLLYEMGQGTFQEWLSHFS